jgi:hypothetical protein
MDNPEVPPEVDPQPEPQPDPEPQNPQPEAELDLVDEPHPVQQLLDKCAVLVSGDITVDEFRSFFTTFKEKYLA